MFLQYEMLAKYPLRKKKQIILAYSSVWNFIQLLANTTDFSILLSTAFGLTGFLFY